MKENCHDQSIRDIVLHKARMAVLSLFVWVFDILQKLCRNPWTLQAFPKDSFELFLPVSLVGSIAWESLWFVSAFSSIKHQNVCRFCAGVDWQDSTCLSAPNKIWWE